MNENELKPSDSQQQPAPPQEVRATGTSSELEAKLTEALNQVDQYKDLLLRKAADFDNYKKRSESEASAIIKFANEDLIIAILPILDDFERSLKLAKEGKENDPFYRGLELIYQKLLKILEAQGVTPLECVGKEFDVHFHHALLQVPREDVPPHTIVEEVEKGYTLHNKVIRHAKVVVSSASLEDETVDRTPSERSLSGDSPDPSDGDQE